MFTFLNGSVSQRSDAIYTHTHTYLIGPTRLFRWMAENLTFITTQACILHSPVDLVNISLMQHSFGIG